MEREGNRMREYILLLPILFIVHDMEEIIGFGKFFRNNPQLFERFPKVTKAYRKFTTEGMALAVYEEFIPFFGISLLAYYFPGYILETIWFGLMLSLTAHFVIHIGQSMFIRKYIPSLITSVILLPVSLCILIRSAEYIAFDLLTVMIISASIFLMMANLRFAHYLMHRCYEKSEGQGENRLMRRRKIF